MPSFSVRFRGVERLRRQLRTRREVLAPAVAAALFVEGETVMAEAKTETPVDTGNLRGSGTVRPPTIEGDRVSVELGFGGPAAPYAPIVHEDLAAAHPVGKAKFLEDPVDRARRGFGRRLAERVRGRLARG